MTLCELCVYILCVHTCIHSVHCICASVLVYVCKCAMCLYMCVCIHTSIYVYSVHM